MATTRTTTRSRRKLQFREVPAVITVVGVGGGGCNAVIRMMEEKPVPGVHYVCANTDIKSLARAPENAKKIYIGERLTHGLGAGGDPVVGAQAAETGREALEKAVGKSDLVFITVGMGGGTGTGAAPVIAEIIKQTGAMTIAIATTPFHWEGAARMETAMAGIAHLREKVDNVIVIHNDLLLNLCKQNVSMHEALKTADQVVTQGVHSVAQVVNVPGEINVDLADVKTIMKLPGRALMAIGDGKGPGGILQAAQTAVANPLINLSIEGAKGILFNVTGGSALTLRDVNSVGEFIAHKVDPKAVMFFGMVNDPDQQDSGMITVIATGIPENGR